MFLFYKLSIFSLGWEGGPFPLSKKVHCSSVQILFKLVTILSGIYTYIFPSIHNDSVKWRISDFYTQCIKVFT